jgi:PAS domain S-box-containing protein
MVMQPECLDTKMNSQSPTSPIILVLYGDDALLDWLRAQGCQPFLSHSLEHAPAEIAALRPDLIWLDIRWRSLDPLIELAAVCAEYAELPILVCALDEQIEAAFAAGAADVVTDSDPDSVRAARLKRLMQTRRRILAAQDDAEFHARRWQQAFARSPVVALLVDANTSEIVDVNAAAVRFYGFSADHLRSLRLRDLETTESHKLTRGTMRSYSHRLASGQTRDVKVFASPIDGIDRDLILMLIFDNTKRREAETAEIRQRTLAEALSHTAAALSSTLDMNTVLDRILQQAARVVPHEAGSVMLLRGSIARVVRSRGYTSLGNASAVNELRLDISKIRSFREVMATRMPIVIPDIREYSDWVTVQPTAWLCSHLCAPIRWGSRVIGFVNLDSAIPGHFTQTDADRVQALADQAAIAIRNAQLYRGIKKQAALLERRIQERTAELDAERGQLHAILDAMVEGVAFVESVPDTPVVDYPIRYVNEAMITLTGYSIEEWTANGQRLFKTPYASEHEYVAVLNKIHSAALEGKTWTGSYKMKRKDGSTFDAFETVTPVMRPDGSLIGIVSVLRDVSDEKALEQERMNFVANASHELRTPIANLKTRLYLARKQPEKLDEHLRVMEEVTGRMQRLVDDLLAISRFQRGTIELRRTMLQLHTTVMEIVALQIPEAERKQQSLTWQVDETPIIVYADAQRIHQVITNLLTNAINYTPVGGRIEVCVCRRVRDQTTYGVIEVKDNGLGISSDDLPYIFQPFYRVTSSVPGTGLGLSIARQIVELHSGFIEVVSSLGKGSAFSVWLPEGVEPHQP